MANDINHAGLPYPVRGAKFTVEIPYVDADGVPTDVVAPDTEVSIDDGAFADCVNEVDVITGGNGVGIITLTGAEMDGVSIKIAAKDASAAVGAIGTLVFINPRILPVVATGTAQAGAAGSITLAADTEEYDFTGCIAKTTGGTGGGGTGGANNQARLIIAYDKDTKIATISPDWEVNPDVDTTYQLLMTDMAAKVDIATIAAGIAAEFDVETLATAIATALNASDIYIKVGPLNVKV